jgi:hypothetical protein
MAMLERRSRFDANGDAGTLDLMKSSLAAGRSCSVVVGANGGGAVTLHLMEAGLEAGHSWCVAVWRERRRWASVARGFDYDALTEGLRTSIDGRDRQRARIRSRVLVGVEDVELGRQR